MKKLKYCINILLIMSACFVVTGCGHEHTWIEATCIEPKVCSECGETEGEPAGHNFLEATCTEPKTCKVCGVIEGEAKGHDFSEATCAEPKTCKICGTTEGETLEHEWIEATFEAPKTCTQCSTTEGGMLVIEEVPELYDIGNSDVGLVPGGYISDNFTSSGFAIKYCDYDGNVKSEIPFKISSVSSRTYTYRLMVNGIIAIYTNFVGSKDFGNICNVITVTDFDGNVIDTKDVVVNSFDLVVDNVNTIDGYYVFCKHNGTIVTAYDLNAQKFVDAEVVEAICKKFAEYSYYLYCPEADCYLVGSGDNYGFADNDGNLIKMFDDASPFSKEGYALVVEDGNVSLVDKNIEVVKENFATGTSVNSIPGREILSIGNNGKRVYYRIATSDAIDTSTEDVADDQEVSGEDNGTESAAIDMDKEANLQDILSIKNYKYIKNLAIMNKNYYISEHEEEQYDKYKYYNVDICKDEYSTPIVKLSFFYDIEGDLFCDYNELIVYDGLHIASEEYDVTLERFCEAAGIDIMENANISEGDYQELTQANETISDGAVIKFDTIKNCDVLELGQVIDAGSNIKVMYYIKDENGYRYLGATGEGNPEYVLGTNLKLEAGVKEEDITTYKKWDANDLDNKKLTPDGCLRVYSRE